MHKKANPQLNELTRLHAVIQRYYSLDELRELCWQLGIEFENLPRTNTRHATVRELILLLGKENRFDELIEQLQADRPHAIFPSEFSSSGSKNTYLVNLYVALESFAALEQPFLERLLQRNTSVLVIVLPLLALVIIGGVIFLYMTLRTPSPKQMPRTDLRIAVAGFSERGQSDSGMGTEFAEGIQLRLQKTFEELNPNFTVTVWGPAQVGTIEGTNANERAISAEQISEKIDATLIVYGTVETEDSIWLLTPEFYVPVKNFYAAEEITGQHGLGTPLTIIGQGNDADRIEISSELTSRTQALAQIAIGLSYYSIENFEKSLAHFQSVEEIEGWEDGEGREVLYLLAGNAAIKTNNIELADSYYQKAISIDPEYARGYLGVAHIYYRLALKPFEETLNYADVDHELLNMALETLEQASISTNQPPRSDISTKIHFERGQIYLIQVYSGRETSFDAAIKEFEIVIADYANGNNPRIQERAAESYARLGLIYELSDYTDLAIEEYQLATSLLTDNSERRIYYEQKLEELGGGKN